MTGVDASAFDLIPEQERGGSVLCVHGLTGTPYEMRPVAEALVARGFRARGPLLPGHGSRVEELAETSWQQWVELVHSEYENLRTTSQQVFVAGLSLGDLLSLELAANKKVDGLLAVGTPLSLRAPIPQLVGLVKHVIKMLKKSQGSDIQDPEARDRHPGYKRMPLSGVHELVRLQRKVRRELRAVTAPALIAHGRLDRTADPGDAMRIFRSLGSQDKEVLYLEASGHVVPVDRDGPELAESAANFFDRLSR
ncbi:MAG: alpha/beta fold hydrolase [Myxococcota bacterium]|nr:alpha/beta fold hydrolase [Myxococcota bacterium]